MVCTVKICFSYRQLSISEMTFCCYHFWFSTFGVTLSLEKFQKRMTGIFDDLKSVYVVLYRQRRLRDSMEKAPHKNMVQGNRCLQLENQRKRRESRLS